MDMTDEIKNITPVDGHVKWYCPDCRYEEDQ